MVFKDYFNCCKVQKTIWRLAHMVIYVIHQKYLYFSRKLIIMGCLLVVCGCQTTSIFYIQSCRIDQVCVYQVSSNQNQFELKWFIIWIFWTLALPHDYYMDSKKKKKTVSWRYIPAMTWSASSGDAVRFTCLCLESFVIHVIICCFDSLGSVIVIIGNLHLVIFSLLVFCFLFLFFNRKWCHSSWVRMVRISASDLSMNSSRSLLDKKSLCCASSLDLMM